MLPHRSLLLVSLDDLASRKPFQSSKMKDASLGVRPEAVVTVYQSCDSVPALNKLNPYRYLIKTVFLYNFCLQDKYNIHVCIVVLYFLYYIINKCCLQNK